MQFLIQGILAMIVLFVLAIGVASIPITETEDANAMDTAESMTTDMGDSSTERIIWSIG
jgi:hypothetical protein